MLLAHRCTIFLCYLDFEIQMKNTETQMTIQRSSRWSITYDVMHLLDNLGPRTMNWKHILLQFVSKLQIIVAWQ